MSTLYPSLGANRLHLAWRAWLGIGVALLCGACRTTPQARSVVLPFHVAVVPSESERLRTDIDQEPGYAVPYELRLEGDRFAEAMSRSLDGLGFTKVSFLPFPDGVTAAEFQSWPASEREAHWVASAAALQADLLLESELSYAPELRWVFPGGNAVLGLVAFDFLLRVGAFAISESRVLVFPVLLSFGWLGSPPDRLFQVDVNYLGGLHDVQALLDPATGADLHNDRARVTSVASYVSRAEVSFLERVGYIKRVISIAIPAPVLPSTATLEHDALRESIGEQVYVDLLLQVNAARGELLAGGGVHPFRVRDLGLAEGESGHRLRVAVDMAEGSVDRMDDYRVWVDGELRVTGSFGEVEPTTTDAGVSYELELELGHLREKAQVRVELRDGAARQGVRSFTLRPDRTGRQFAKAVRFDLSRRDD